MLLKWVLSYPCLTFGGWSWGFNTSWDLWAEGRSKVKCQSLWLDPWWHKSVWTVTLSHLLHLVTFLSCLVWSGSLPEEHFSLAGRHLSWHVKGKQAIFLEIFLIPPYVENEVLKKKQQYSHRQVQWPKSMYLMGKYLFALNRRPGNFEGIWMPSSIQASWKFLHGQGFAVSSQLFLSPMCALPQKAG